MTKIRTAGTRRIGRRELVTGALALGATLVAPAFNRRVSAQPRLSGPPFTLGVASGYPSPTGVVLWTRLAPSPLMPAGGMPPEVVPLEWEVATDDRMGRIVQRGIVGATPAFAHSVHVEVENLEPGRWYWYRFRAVRAAPRRGLPRLLRAHAAAPLHGAFRAAHAAPRARGVRPTRPVPSPRRSPVPLAPAVPRTGPRRSQRGRRLRSATGPASDDARRGAGALAHGGARPRARALERDRPADAHGSARSQARARPAVLDGRMGRLSCGAPSSARLPRPAQAGQPNRPRRRRALVLGGRPQARLRRCALAGGCDRVRRHFHHLAVQPPSS